MKKFKHFSHEHELRLVQLKPAHNNKNSGEEDNDAGDEDKYKDKDLIVAGEYHFVCKMCEEEIYLFQRCYYACNKCDYSLHTFCAELPETQQNHPLHPDHKLTLCQSSNALRCDICKLRRKVAYWYYCYNCRFIMDIICATTSVQKMDHPSHPHQLQRNFGQIISHCSACGDEQSGTFYHCTTCYCFTIHLSCALLPTKLLIQQSTNENFSHSHLLTLSYSFPFIDLKARYFPRCRVCQRGFDMNESEDKPYTWNYRCDKCRYYVHVNCATSKKDAFMSSILMPAVAMEQLNHFSHAHMLHLVQLKPNHDNKNSDEEDNDDEDEYKDEDRIAAEEDHFRICKMCDEDIYSFQLCYYTCNDCDYSLHKFCAELPETQQNHPLHPNHTVRLNRYSQAWRCDICNKRKKVYMYNCSTCEFIMDIICATMSVQKMDHPSHPHQLQRYYGQTISNCNACGDEHSGTFYQCTTCSWFKIHLSCALLPTKLLIQQSTNESFSHSHLLTLSYSFPYIDLAAKLFPRCRVCRKGSDPRILKHRPYLWHFRCDKCQYYVHVDCATSRKDAFMSSILMPAGYGKTYKNYKEDDHPNLIHCPLADESVNLLTHLFINKGELVIKREISGEMFCHPHPLILFDTFLNGSVSLHDPMKKVELLYDGCVRPITNMPFYKCSQHDCDFALHEWCTRLPSQIQDHPDHPEHTLVFIPKAPTDYLGVFSCRICRLRCNGFAYGCMQCEYYVDINCVFIPDVIMHEAHPKHLLLRFEASSEEDKYCKACREDIDGRGFYCPTCDFYLHSKCALLLPRTIRHKYDKHPLTLRYYSVENHSGEYFCEICEHQFDPAAAWFYHCSTCTLSMHTACAPIKLQCERSTFSYHKGPVFEFLNVKFGRRFELRDHPHPLTFVQGINDDDQCSLCDRDLQYDMIFKCCHCEFALHWECGLFFFS